MDIDKQEVHIFIGSSITEFKDDRQVLADYIYCMRDILEDNHISIVTIPEMCEFVDTAMSPTRKQDDFNQRIDISDMCIFMFGLVAGGYSVEEVDYALCRVKKNRTEIPIINVFFRNQREGELIDSSVETLRVRLDDKYVHHGDGRFFLGNIKLRIVQDISVLAKENFPITFTVEDGTDGRCKCLLNLADERILDLDETDLFETDGELRVARADYEKEDDVSRKKDIRMELEKLVETRLGLN